MPKLKLPEMVAVKSSQIQSIGHDKESNTLYIQFKRGGMYKYNPVTSEGHKAIMGAESIGSYFHQNIKTNNRINCEKVTPE